MQALSQGSRDSNDADNMGYGWAACTTDEILSTKENLYDHLVTVPPPYTKQAKEKVWPRIEVRKGTQIKATQRDLRRYRTLRRELRRNTDSLSPYISRHSNHGSITNLPTNNRQETYDEASSVLDADLAEPQSWSALTYNSFMWWASAGEQRTDLDEEEEYDAALLRHFDSYRDGSPSRPRSARKSSGQSPDVEDGHGAGVEMTIIAYFHRFTTLILKTLSDVIDTSDAEIDCADGEQDPLKARSAADPVCVSSEDMTRMGLDVWSEGDREFVKGLVALYWGRKADVRGGRMECCGVRIC